MPAARYFQRRRQSLAARKERSSWLLDFGRRTDFPCERDCEKEDSYRRFRPLLSRGGVARRAGVAYRRLFRNVARARLKAAGCSRLDKCEAEGMTTSSDPGSAAWISRAIATGVPASCSPTITSDGHFTSFSRPVRLIWGIAWQQPAYPGTGVARIIALTRAITSGRVLRNGSVNQRCRVVSTSASMPLSCAVLMRPCHSGSASGA